MRDIQHPEQRKPKHVLLKSRAIPSKAFAKDPHNEHA
jgi:hypothetical protein